MPGVVFYCLMVAIANFRLVGSLRMGISLFGGRHHSSHVRNLLQMTETCESEVVTETGAKLPDKFNSKFLSVMSERGYIHQCTDFDNLDKKFSNSTITAYLGFDATASSLHVGSLLQIMILRNLQKCGHKPIILIGGGTTKVGDPTGKDESRQLLSQETIQSNADSIAKVFEKFISFGNGPTDAMMVNNADWLDKLNYLEFLRDYGRYFTINRMLSFESVKQRLQREQPLTFLEFNYMLLQAYDFLELNRRHGAVLQLGGSDQWGNIISGVELARKIDQTSLYGLTAPLLTTSDGKKMGKTAAGAVWLNRELLPEFEYWQFWRNTADDDVIRFLKLFTEVSLEDIERMATWTGAELNAAKVVLADEATRLLHGGECLSAIHATAQSLFASGGGGDLDSLEKMPLLRSTALGAMLGSSGVPVVELLLGAGMVSSKAEGKRLIKAGGARVNDAKVEEEGARVTEKDFDEQGRLKLSSGKKKHVLVVVGE